MFTPFHISIIWFKAVVIFWNSEELHETLRKTWPEDQYHFSHNVK